MNINVKVQGVEKIMKDFSEKGIQAKIRADKVTETYTRQMANQAGDNAPVDSGDLRADVISSPRRLSDGVWEFGGTLPYARRQEYEHASNKGFIRKAVWDNRNPYREAIRREVTKD